MTITHLHSSSFLLDRAAAPPRRRLVCPRCKQHLQRLGENSRVIAYGCKDWHCPNHDHPEWYEPKNPDGNGHTYRNAWGGSNTYEAYKARKRENYRLLRDIGVEPKQANRLSASNGQTQLTLDEAKNE